MKKEATYDPIRKAGTYSHNPHHGEMLPGARLTNDAPNASSQNLSDKRGMEAAKKSLLSRYQELENNKTN
jgi:hypothetical protein